MLGKFSTLISSKIFSYSFFSLLFLQILVHLILFQRSLRLSLVLFILFPLFCYSAVILCHSIFQLTYPFFCLNYSAIGSSSVFFISVIMLFIVDCSLFLLGPSEIFLLSSQSIRSDQISHSVVSDSLRPHESQHARPPCPSPTPRVHSDSCLSSQICHPAISSSVVPFSSGPQSLPASESIPMSQLFA